MKLVVVESPYAGDLNNRRTNIRYLIAALQDCHSRNEAPFASHAIYPMFLNDSDQWQREHGITMGFLWGSQAELVAVYMDRGVSHGMHAAIAHWRALKKPIEYRYLRGEWEE